MSRLSLTIRPFECLVLATHDALVAIQYEQIQLQRDHVAPVAVGRHRVLIERGKSYCPSRKAIRVTADPEVSIGRELRQTHLAQLKPLHSYRKDPER